MTPKLPSFRKGSKKLKQYQRFLGSILRSSTFKASKEKPKIIRSDKY